MLGQPWEILSIQVEHRIRKQNLKCVFDKQKVESTSRLITHEGGPTKAQAFAALTVSTMLPFESLVDRDITVGALETSLFPKYVARTGPTYSTEVPKN